MIIVDTNVFSELTRPAPSEAVLEWYRHQDPDAIFFSAVGEAEVRAGAAFLPAGKRRDRTIADIEAALENEFADQVLPFDRYAAVTFAEISAVRRRLGLQSSFADRQIAAIAAHHGAIVATRNVKDFEHCGIEIVNPWEFVANTDKN